MNRRAALLLPAMLALPCLAGDGTAIRPFRRGSLAHLQAAREGRPFLLVLWSLTCAPCRQEFALFRELRKSHPRLPLVLISTDDIADAATAREVLGEYGLEQQESWIFADADAAALRYEIDPSWYGEMPRAYFYDTDHRREAVSGSLDRARLEAWITEIRSPA